MEKFEITPHVEKFEVWSWRLCGLCWFYAVGKVLEMVTHVKVRSARWVSVLILVCTFRSVPGCTYSCVGECKHV